MTDRKRIFCMVAVLTAPLVVYARTLGYPFVSFDDPNYVVDNPLLRAGVSWTELLFTPQLGYPMPVTVAVYRLLRFLGGAEPGIHHGFNWILHGVNALLLYLLVERLFDARRAALAALLWGLHPLTAEPVAWCSGTKDLLYGAFTLAAVGCQVRALERDEPGSWTTGVLVFGVLAILSKPVAFLLPVVLLLVPVVTGRTVTLRAWRHRLGYVTMALVACLVVVSGTLISRHAGGEIRYKTITDTAIGSVEHLDLILTGVGMHARHLLVPLGLVPAYLPPAAAPWSWLYPLLGVLAIGLTGAGLCWSWRRQSRTRFWLLAAFAVSYAPVSQVIPTIHFAPDSYLYVPGMFLAAYAVSGISGGGRPSRKGWTVWAARLGVVAFFHVLGILSMHQVRIWDSSSALWTANTLREPGDAAIAVNLAKAWDLEGRRDEAVRVLEARLGDIIDQGRVDPFVLETWEASHGPASTRALYTRLLREQEEIPPLYARRWVEFLRREDLALRPEEIGLTRAGLAVLAAAVERGGQDPERLRQLAGAAHWLGLREDCARLLEAHFLATRDDTSGGMAMGIFRELGLEEDAARVEARLRGHLPNGSGPFGIKGGGPRRSGPPAP
ncbi:MAG: glycosyltransferase family 39 protein [Pseudomonadota bacterium]